MFLVIISILCYHLIRNFKVLIDLYLNKQLLPFIILFCLLFSFTGICFLIPQFSFLFLTGFGGLLTFISIPFGSWSRTQSLSITQKMFMDQFFIFLRDTGLLDLFIQFYIIFCFVSHKAIYYYRLALIFFFSSCSILVSRWYFIHVILLKDSLSFYEKCVIYFILFLGVVMIYFRLSLNFSLFLITKSLTTYPNYLSPHLLFILDGEEGTPPSSTPLPNQPGRKFALVNIQFTRASYRNYYQPSSASVRTLGICLGVAGCAAALITAAYTIQQTGHAKTQAEQAVIQSKQATEANRLKRWEMAHQNPKDAPIVFQGHPEELKSFENQK